MSQRPGFTLRAQLKDGVLTLNRERMGQLLRRLSRFGKDGEYDVRIEKHVNQRSLAQNNYLHACVFDPLAEHFGNTIEECKYVLMGECFGWKFDAIANREIPVQPSTSSMNVEQAGYFIDWVIPWALEKHDFIIELPNEEHGFDEKRKVA